MVKPKSRKLELPEPGSQAGAWEPEVNQKLELAPKIRTGSQ